MIPKVIAIQLVQLKKKIITYSFKQRSLDVGGRRDEVYEIKAEVEKTNNEISDLSNKVNNILVDGLISKFEIENWFEVLKDKSDFSIPNPREIYEEEQLELKWRKQIAEEKIKQEIEEFQIELRAERIEVYRALCYDGPESYNQLQHLIENGLDIKQDGRIYDISTLINRGRSSRFIKFLIEAGLKVNEDEQIELEILIETEKEKEKRQIEESQQKLKTKRNDDFKNICYNGPDDIHIVQKLIINGLDITQIDESPSIKYLIANGRGMEFIKFLVSAGLKITIQDFEFCFKSNSKYNSPEFVNFLLSAKNIAEETIVIAKAALKRKEEDERILLKQESKLSKLKELTQGKYNSFYKLLKDGDITEIKQVFSLSLLDVNQRIKMNNSEVTFYILSIFESRSIEFVQLLVDAGYCVTKKNIEYYYDNRFKYPNYKQIVNVLLTSKSIEKEAIGKVNEIRKENERVSKELEQKKLHYIKESQIAEFRFICYIGPNDINKVQQLIDEGLDITQRNVFYSIAVIIDRKTSIDFIRFLIDAGMFVTKNDIEFCFKNSFNPLCKELLNFLITAKNIDNNALVLVEEIKNEKGISSASIASKEPSNSIVEEKVKPIITNTIHLHGDQLPRRNQTEYEIPNAQGIISIAGSDKEFNHKEIKIKKIILWIVIVLFIIALIVLFFIYFEEVIIFLKAMLIIIIVFALFAWRYSPTKRR